MGYHAKGAGFIFQSHIQQFGRIAGYANVLIHSSRTHLTCSTDVGELGLTEHTRGMAGHRQTHIDVLIHLDFLEGRLIRIGCFNHVFPGNAVTGVLGCDNIAFTGQLHPVRCRNGTRVAARAVGSFTCNRTTLPADSSAGRDVSHRISRVCVKCVANHNACFCPVVGLLDTEHLRHNRAVTFQLPVHEMELIRVAPDVGPGTYYCVGPGRFV